MSSTRALADSNTAVSKDGLHIPIIDFSPFLHGSPLHKESTGVAIANAFKTAGFVYLSNYGISRDTVNEVFASSAAFFRRPIEQKQQLAWTSPESNRGYVSIGREKVSQLNKEGIDNLRKTNPDLKESFEIGRDGVPGFPNNWPDTIDAEGEAFTTLMKSFFATCKDLHIQIMRAIALGMNLPETFFDEHTNAGDNNLRLLHYPTVQKSVFKENKGQVRAGEHSDYGTITMLFQDDQGGLEVKSPTGTWVPATPIPNTIVINAGDLLARWSNDQIKSTHHRVMEPKESIENEDSHPARYSLVYFCNPNFDSWIEALPGTWEKEGKKYEGIKCFDHLVKRLSITHA